MNIQSIDKKTGDRKHTVIRGEHAEIHKEERQGNIRGMANCPGKLQHRLLASCLLEF